MIPAALDRVRSPSDFDKAVEDALKNIRYWAQNSWRYEYVVHRNGGEVIVRLEKVR